MRIKERLALPRTTKSSEDDEAKIPLLQARKIVMLIRGMVWRTTQASDKNGYNKPFFEFLWYLRA